MKVVKSLLLGTAAGFVAFAGAQAADLPVKAKPVQYVKICDLYGAGYFYVPGTETCIKLGGYVRFNTYLNAPNGLVATTGANGRYNWAETKDVTTRARVYLTGDVRSQTAYGTLRSYYAVQFQNAGSGVAGTASTPVNTAIIRAFIQFAGFTIGRSTSLSDTPDAFGGLTNNGWPGIGGTTAPNGINVVQYTYQFGNGFSASIGLEDSDQRDRSVANVTTAALTGALDSSSSGAGIGSPVPEIVANIDVTQAWGSARIVGALHNVRAAYYNAPYAGVNNANCVATLAYPGNEACGRPSDKWGYYIGAGFTVTAIPGMPGDLFGVSGGYSDGATAYSAGVSSLNMVKGNTVTLGTAPDGVYTNGGSIQTTKSWWVASAYQHAWMPNLKTSLYGAYVGVDFNQQAQNAIAVGMCPGGTPVGNCNPDYSYWLVGSRIFNWTPVQNLDIGLDIVYWKFNSAFKGSPDRSVGAPFAQTKKVGNNDTWVANLQITRSFWP